MELPNGLSPTFILKILANLTVEFHYRTTTSTQIVALYKLPILVGSGFLILILILTLNPFSAFTTARISIFLKFAQFLLNYGLSPVVQDCVLTITLSRQGTKPYVSYIFATIYKPTEILLPGTIRRHPHYKGGVLPTELRRNKRS